MTFKAFVEDIEAVDENLREFYKPLDEGEGYILNVEASNGYSVENVDGLKSALSKERARATEFEKKYGKVSKQFEGVDLDEISSLKAEHEKLQKQYEKISNIDPESEAAKLAEEKVKEIEEKAAAKEAKQKKEWQKLHDADVGSRDEKINSLTSQLKSLMIDNTATNALAEAGIRPEHLELILPKVTSAIRLADSEDGSLTVEVVDAEGTPRVRNDGSNMSISDLIPEFQAKWPDSFTAEVKRGGGIRGTKHPSKKPSEELSSREQIAKGLEARLARGK